MAIYLICNNRMNSPKRTSNAPKAYTNINYSIDYRFIDCKSGFSKTGFPFSKQIKRQVGFNSLNWCLNSLYFFKSEQFIIHSASFITH